VAGSEAFVDLMVLADPSGILFSIILIPRQPTLKYNSNPPVEAKACQACDPAFVSLCPPKRSKQILNIYQSILPIYPKTRNAVIQPTLELGYAILDDMAFLMISGNAIFLHAFQHFLTHESIK
jgi:hypothetical protein